MTLKELITGYREEHNMSQRQFATACGLSNGYISMIEREVNPNTGEKIVPTLVALQKLATGMHITLADLLIRVDDMPVDIAAEWAPTPVSEDGLDREAKEVADAYKIADPYVQFSVRRLLDLDTQNMEFQFAARKSDKPHHSTGSDTDVQI